jgi:plasmid stability protein
MAMTVPVPDEVHRALEDRARAVGITVEAYVADVLTRAVQPDPLEAFIGIGASGRTDALEMRGSRRELAARKLAEGLSSL